MSDPITFPIKAYRAEGINLQMRIFDIRESSSLELNGKSLRYNAPALFGDYGNEPEYYCTDLNAVKNNVLADMAIQYAKAVLEIKNFYA